MPRHLLEIADLSRDDVDDLLAMADEGPRPGSLAGLTYLSAFFQESTRTRLGFMSAAARQGATVMDMGDADRLRREPRYDQQMVLAEAADVLAVRHWDAAFAADLASRNGCAVVNAGAGPKSHPTQALIDGYTLSKVFHGEAVGRRVLFLGDTLLRSGQSFRELAALLGMAVSHRPISAADPDQGFDDEVRSTDVVYIQSLDGTDYSSPDLNATPHGPALPPRIVDSISRSSALIMHALPRGPELPDSLMHDQRCLVAKQIGYGLSVRGAVLRWLMQGA